MNGTTPKSITNEMPMNIEVHPAQPVQPADRNLVHVTKAQMKGARIIIVNDINKSC